MHTLIFPQWQGSGDRADVYHGALQAATLPKGAIWQVPVSPTERDEGTPDGIRHGDVLTRYAAQAFGWLREVEPETLLTIGGDCGVEVPSIAYLNYTYAGLVVLWIDAHADLNTPATSPSGHYHGMALRTLLGAGPRRIQNMIVKQWDAALRPEQVVIVGAREFDPPEWEYIAANAIPVLDAASINESPEEIAAFIASADPRYLYVHVDVDVLDPAEFPPIFYPTVDGVKFDALLAFLRILGRDARWVGAGVTEFGAMDAASFERFRVLYEALEAPLRIHQ